MTRKIYCIISDGFDSNIYIIFSGENIIAIDSGTGLNRDLISEVKKIINPDRVDYVINTHSHIDHCGGNHIFKNAKILIHKDDSEEMIKGTYYNTGRFVENPPKYKPDIILKGNEKFDFGEYCFRIIHTPGHTKGSICIYEEDEKILFSGDLIFADGLFGRTDLGGDEEDMKESLEYISSLDVKILYPGHGRFVEEDAERHIKLALWNYYEIFGI